MSTSNNIDFMTLMLFLVMIVMVNLFTNLHSSSYYNKIHKRLDTLEKQQKEFENKVAAVVKENEELRNANEELSKECAELKVSLNVLLKVINK